MIAERKNIVLKYFFENHRDYVEHELLNLLSTEKLFNNSFSSIYEFSKYLQKYITENKQQVLDQINENF